MSETHIDPEARQGRFTGRFALHDILEILEQLGRAAVTEATSAASIGRQRHSELAS
jgi:hypothetical protein